MRGGLGGLALVDATSNGSQVLFETPAALSPKAEAGVPNLYEWNEGSISLVAADSAGGPYNFEEGQEAGAAGGYYTQNTISQDGSRIFYTNLATGRIYVYLPLAGKAVEVSSGAAEWRAATPSGAFVFYTESGELYRFNAEAAEEGEEDGPEPLASGVEGTLGVSDDGSDVYLAREVGRAITEIDEWHDGAFTYVATVSKFNDKEDWIGRCACDGEKPGEGEKTSRVSADGSTLLFTSASQLTSYNNNDQYEFYLYYAPTNKVICVSCNPTGEPATYPAYLIQKPPFFAATSKQVLLTRNLSEDGDRVFFQTQEALLSADVDNQMDVYEWEREGAGSCLIGGGDDNGGCLYLISPGTSSTAEAYFGNADAEGNNVFFFTRQSLVGQDQDYNADLYDARVNGGMESQNLPLAASCASEEVCRGRPSPAPEFGTPSSAIFSGSVNLVPQPPVKPKPTKPKKPKRKKARRQLRKGRKPVSRHDRRESK